MGGGETCLFLASRQFLSAPVGPDFARLKIADGVIPDF
jgi:hypothetical protein